MHQLGKERAPLGNLEASIAMGTFTVSSAMLRIAVEIERAESRLQAMLPSSLRDAARESVEEMMQQGDGSMSRLEALSKISQIVAETGTLPRG